MADSNKSLDQMNAQDFLNLGKEYFHKGDFEQANRLLKHVIKSDSYTTKDRDKALFTLGAMYYEKKYLNNASKYWNKISTDNIDGLHAQGLYYIGVYHQNKNNYKESIEAYCKAKNILNSTILKLRTNGPVDINRIKYLYNKYILISYNLGIVYNNMEDFENSIDTFKDVRNDESDIYFALQLYLGKILYDNNKIDESIKVWESVPDSHRKRHVEAQYRLGVAYGKVKKYQKSISILNKIPNIPENRGIYARSQIKLGEIYEILKEFDEAKSAYNNSRDIFYYKSERNLRILECSHKLVGHLFKLKNNVDSILEFLQVTPESESEVAHYTRASTAFKMLNNKEPSAFRLSTINGVNDPTEGIVLGDFWRKQGILENIHISTTTTFISCFTFNHDSLNQFRLYGKESNQEATGVSLVFKKDFFNTQLTPLGFIANPPYLSSYISREMNKTNELKDQIKNPLPGEKYELYRCIYLDPETGYLTLAQRDKLTFYRESKEDGEAEEKWGNYHSSTLRKEEDIKTFLFGEKDKINDNNSILSILKYIFKETHSYNNEEKQQILETVRFILLPLQYLVKHIAFQEEQECRIMYTTHLHDEKIRHDWEKQWMYVEYEACVRDHIDKIYLSPGAAKYQDHFRILLDQGSGKSKVRISQNPFRNKE